MGKALATGGPLMTTELRDAVDVVLVAALLRQPTPYATPSSSYFMQRGS